MGFSFNGRHSDEFKIGVKNIAWVVKPEKRVVQSTIPGRDGTYDFTDGTYNNAVVEFECDYKGPAFKATRNDIGLWLAGSGYLQIDGFTDRVYSANIYGEIPLSQIFVVKQFTLTFECYPFSESPVYNQITETFTKSPHETDVLPKGTQDMPCIIQIRNIGTKNVSGIVITRKGG